MEAVLANADNRFHCRTNPSLAIYKYMFMYDDEKRYAINTEKCFIFLLHKKRIIYWLVIRSLVKNNNKIIKL